MDRRSKCAHDSPWGDAGHDGDYSADPVEGRWRKAEQKSEEEMMGKNRPVVPNMNQRSVMQYLNTDDWKIAAHLPIPAGEMMLVRLNEYGWIESQGEKQRTAIRLTQAGLEALRLVI
jgi:hypothetical protein